LLRRSITHRTVKRFVDALKRDVGGELDRYAKELGIEITDATQR
jgi:hypothetical protein